MSDKTIRHLISLLGFLVAIIIYIAGYAAGTRGWWFIGITTIIVYAIVYKLVEA